MAQARACQMSHRRAHGLCDSPMGGAIEGAMACQTSHGLFHRPEYAPCAMPWLIPWHLKRPMGGCMSCSIDCDTGYGRCHWLQHRPMGSAMGCSIGLNTSREQCHGPFHGLSHGTPNVPRAGPWAVIDPYATHWQCHGPCHGFSHGTSNVPLAVPWSAI